MGIIHVEMEGGQGFLRELARVNAENFTNRVMLR
jgi:hypothetical protein